jgi:hypothetical protein
MATKPPSPHSQLWRWEVEKYLLFLASTAGAEDIVSSDTPPANPAANLLWFDSTTGCTFIWYVDQDSGQWVQIAAPMGDFVYRGGDTMSGLLTLSGPPTNALHAASKAYVDGRAIAPPPNDDGEYVLINGVWRLKSQTFDLSGKTQQDVAVPAWGPTQARITSFYYTGNVGQSGLRVSGDGTTFDAGNIYAGAGFYHISQSGGFSNYANVNSTYFLLASSVENVSIAGHVDAVLDLARGAGGYVNYRVKSGGYSNTNQMIHYFFDGWVMPTTGTVSLKAFRMLANSGVFNSGKLVVEWLA